MKYEVRCFECAEKEPAVIRSADFLVPVRKKPYDLIPNTGEIDKRLIGVCSDCLAKKSKFHQNAKVPADAANPDLIFRPRECWTGHHSDKQIA